MRFRFLIVIIIIFVCKTFSQDGGKGSYNILLGKKINNDTLPHKNINEVYVYSHTATDNWWLKYKYKRLIRNIKKVYPYAKYAHKKFYEMDQHYQSLETNKEKRQYMNQLEKEILNEFEDDLKKLTISQGRLLLKLIDRETSHTSYEILKEYKGSVSAFFWQALAKLFGSDLKSGYDPYGKDSIIEEIIFLYERGLI